MNIREELVRIQKELVSQIRDEIEVIEGATSKALQQYSKEYQETVQSFRRISDKDELIKSIASADICLIGDFHTLRQSQKAVIRILEELIELEPFVSGKKKVILGLELLQVKHKNLVDGFLSKADINRDDENEFLNAIDYYKTWGFNWEHYKVLFDFARQHKITLFGLNSQPSKNEFSRYRLRDKIAAQEIVKHTSKNDTLVLVLVGEFHISENHIPILIEKFSYGDNLKIVIVHQNISKFYWELAERGLAEIIDVVLIKDNVFCIINTTPIAKYQSYLNWQMREEEIPYGTHSELCEFGDDSIDLADIISQYVETICKFLEIKVPPLENLSVYSSFDTEFIKKIFDDINNPEELKEIEEQIKHSESFFIHQKEVIFLPNLSINHAAEEATSFIHSHTSNVKAKRDKKDEYYFNIIHKALCYFGSKIINHKRLTYKEKDFSDWLEEIKHKRLKTEKLKLAKKNSQLVMKHIEREKEHIQTGKWRPLRNFFNMPQNLKYSTTKSLGHLLGEKLYNAMLLQEIQKQEIRELFYKKFTKKSEPFEMYLTLVKRFSTLQDFYKSKSEKL